MAPETPRNDHTLLLLVVALFLFHSPFSTWWTSLNLPWYLIFVAWGILILLIALNRRRSDRNRGH